MSSSPVYMFGMLFFGLMMIFMVDMIAYTSNYLNASNAAAALMNVGEKYGEIREDNVNVLMDRYELSQDEWDVTYTEGAAQLDETIQLHLTSSYQIKILSVLGEQNRWSIPISIQREVTSSVYQR